MTRKRFSSQKAVQYILDLPCESESEMSDLDHEFSEGEIDLDIRYK